VVTQLVMNPSLKPIVDDFIQEHQLPEEYSSTVEQWFAPLAEELLQDISAHNGPYVIGISGCQGSGKSTLAALLVLLMNQMLGLRCINLSIDDFYLTHAERQALASSVHPLLATRGVPGTHDMDLAINTINALKTPGEVAVPRFDKAVDDREPQAQWPIVQAPMDVIVLEGWCLAIEAQPEESLIQAVNELEANEDPDSSWRRYVNTAMQDRYQTFNNLIDYLVMLKAPDFEKVYQWRQSQEEKLAEKFHRNGSVDSHQIMIPTELKRFIQHYERVTRHGLDTLPDKADVVFQLTDRQTIDKRL
jgi:D-glycerate 3-kinase